MKEVRLEWLKKEDLRADDILSVISFSEGTEIVQLRRLYSDRCERPSTYRSAYEKNVWKMRAVHYSDSVIASHLGENWDDNIHRGFERVDDFKEWLKDRRWRSNVSKKSC